MNIMDYIPRGKANAVSRTTLTTLTGLNDRTVRREIENARDNGYMICNYGQGYFVTDNNDDIYKQYNQDTSRALSILKRRKPMRDRLKKAGYKV